MTLKVLVADDEEGYRWPLAKMLSDSDFEVLEASDYDEAVRLGREADIWVIDVRLPTSKNEGILVVRQLVEENVTSSYPVFFISVLPESLANEELDILRQWGVRYEFLEKPFEPEFLLKRINDSL